jgi:hypothetical protein
MRRPVHNVIASPAILDRLALLSSPACRAEELDEFSEKEQYKKRRGRSATGHGVQIGTLWPKDTIASIDAWIAKQEDSLGRSEAIRRLVDLGLRIQSRSKQEAVARADRANELASSTIDSLTAGTLDNAEKANRKGRLIKGPDESRECG